MTDCGHSEPHLRSSQRPPDVLGLSACAYQTGVPLLPAYVFRDPKAAEAGRFPATSENPTGTPNQEIPGYLRPVLRERVEAKSITDMDRDAVASRDRQLAALKAAMA